MTNSDTVQSVAQAQSTELGQLSVVNVCAGRCTAARPLICANDTRIVTLDNTTGTVSVLSAGTCLLERRFARHVTAMCVCDTHSERVLTLTHAPWCGHHKPPAATHSAPLCAVLTWDVRLGVVVARTPLTCLCDTGARATCLVSAATATGGLFVLADKATQNTVDLTSLYYVSQGAHLHLIRGVRRQSTVSTGLPGGTCSWLCDTVDNYFVYVNGAHEILVVRLKPQAYSKHLLTPAGTAKSYKVRALQRLFVSASTTRVDQRGVTHTCHTQLHSVCCAHNTLSACLMIASGDRLGRIFLWCLPTTAGTADSDTRLASRSTLYCVLHWHTLPVNCLRFSSDGARLYSGGDEQVLVVWSTPARQQPQSTPCSVLPRLSAPPLHLATSSTTQLLLLLLADSTMCLVRHDNVVERTLLSATLALPRSPRCLAWCAWEPALVLDGPIGHVQFVSLTTRSQLFCVDVAQANILNRDRALKTARYYDVHQVAFVSNVDASNWMVTSESSASTGVGDNCRLKFWRHLPHPSTYVLETCCTNPQGYGQPAVCGGRRLEVLSAADQCVLTHGTDTRVRVWHYVTHKEMGWRCTCHFEYQDRAVLDVCVSRRTAAAEADQQLGHVAALFDGDVIVVWDLDTRAQLCVLCRDDQPAFSRVQQLHFVTASTLACLCDRSHICFWDTGACTLHTAAVKLSACHLMCVDVSSDLVALFTHTHVLLFRAVAGVPQGPVVRRRLAGACDSHQVSVLSAAFVPQETCADENVSVSRLYYVSSEGALYTLDWGAQDHNWGASWDGELETSVAITPTEPRGASTLMSCLVAGAAQGGGSGDTVCSVQAPRPYAQRAALATKLSALDSATSYTMPCLTHVCAQMLTDMLCCPDERDDVSAVDTKASASSIVDGTSGDKVANSSRNLIATSNDFSAEQIVDDGFDWL